MPPFVLRNSTLCGPSDKAVKVSVWKRIILSFLLLLTCQPPAQAGGRATVFNVVIEMIVGAGGVFAAAHSAEAKAIYDQKAAVVDDLKERKLNPRDGAIFQIYFSVDPHSAHRWFLSPNVYALVQPEGQGDFIPASITKGYRGQPLSLTIYGRQIRPGGRILVHILDDKEFWNTTWNSLLQTEIPFPVVGVTVTPMVKVQWGANGKIRVLNKDITFQPPGRMATADITVPSASDGIWMADGTLYDVEKKPVGKLQFGQIWRADPRLLTEMSTLTWRIVFWGGLAIVLGLVFVWQFKRTDAKA